MATQQHELKYYVVQPWGPDKVRNATRVSEHATVGAAYATIDWYATLSARKTVGLACPELLVVDSDGRLVTRPECG